MKDFNRSSKCTYIIMVCLCFLVIFTSCNNSGRRESNINIFNDKDTLASKIKYIEGCSKQIDLVPTKNYYIVQSDVEANHEQLSVYEKKTEKYLYSFAVKGHGKNETIAMDMFQTSKDDTLEIIDQAKYKILKYKIHRDSTELISEKFIKLKNVGPLQEVYRHNDSIIVFNTLDCKLQTYNDLTNSIVSVYDVCDSLGIEKSKKDIVNYHFAYYENKICLGFRHFNSITMGHIDNDGMIVIPNIKDLKDKAEKADKDKYYYAFVSMNGNNIIAQYMGYSLGFVKKMASNYNLFSPQFEIEIYTTDLKPYKHVMVDTDILRCKLSDGGNSFYSWNPLDVKGNILVFKY